MLIVSVLLTTAVCSALAAAPAPSPSRNDAAAPVPIPFPYIPEPIEYAEEEDFEEDLFEEAFLPDLPFEYHHPTDAPYPEDYFPWRGMFKTPEFFFDQWWEEEEMEFGHAATATPTLIASALFVGPSLKPKLPP